MWLPQGGALKIENLQFTQYSIIILLSSMHQSLLTTSNSPKKNLAKFGSSNISEAKKATPTKIGVHTLHVHPYLHEFFEPIPIN